MQLLDGKLVSAQIIAELQRSVQELKDQHRRPPHLAAILVGDHGSSETYVAAKIKACQSAGFSSSLFRFARTISEKDLIAEISRLNEDDGIDGILVQLPLPAHINPAAVIGMVGVEKDVDGFHPLNLGKMVAGLPGFLPATPYGMMLLLEYYKIETRGKHAIVLGRSAIVGTPVSILLSRNAYPGNCTVTLCHSHTPQLKSLCQQGDILVAALGKPGFVTGAMVKEGAVVLDVGTTLVADPSRKSGFRLQGDVNFQESSEKCSFITPVPGGIGPMTIAGLLKNTLKAALARQKDKVPGIPAPSDPGYFNPAI